jgi:uncharacterized protein (DUF2236 family)
MAKITPKALDPNGLVWENWGRFNGRNWVNGLRAPMLQNMHPGLAAGVEQHSVFFEDPLARLQRSIGPLMSVVYGGENAHEWGKLIRGFHTSIRGIDKYGRRYHALDPETYYWAHATMIEETITGRELLGIPLSEADKHEFYRESIDWYRLYGVSMRPVPTDYDAFQEYWEYTLEHVLEDSRPVREGFRMHRTAPPPSLPLREPLGSAVARAIVKPLLQSPALRLIGWVTVGGFPPVIRERLCLDWTASDELRYRLYLKAVQKVYAALPEDAQFLPIARQARATYRDTGTVAPLALPAPRQV